MTTTAVVHLKSTRSEIKKAISSIPQELTKGDKATQIMHHVAQAMLELISAAFIVKSSGGTDESGDRWAPLKPSTIAYRAARSRAESKRATRPSQALTSKQQNRWWELYRKGLAINKGNKAAAARYAWFIIKSEGGKTLIGRYGTRKALILNHTGELLKSLTPGSNSPYQIIKVDKGQVTIGTSRKGAMVHHHGAPRKGIPQRRLWPDTSKWPRRWWDHISRQIQLGIAEMAAKKVRNLT